MERTIKKNIIRWLPLLCGVMLLAGMSACSDETPGGDDWRKDLTPHYAMCPVVENPMPIVGTDFRFIALGVRITNKSGTDMLSNIKDCVLDSDFYFEIDGKKYFLGDSVPVQGLGKSGDKVMVLDHHAYRFRFLTCFYICPSLDTKYIRFAPFDFSFDFVWPSKGIRKHMRMYVEFNKNFFEDGKHIDPSLWDEYGYGTVLYYKTGYWADGVLINKHTCGDENEQMVEIIVD